MRLDKYIKHALCISRGESCALIKSGRVLVNNKKANASFDVKLDDIVTYNNEEIKYKEFYYYMLNKPSGYVSSTSNHDGTPVTSLIKERNDLSPVGRLDKDTEGLIILTNDGSLIHHLTSPKHNIEKKYYVESRSKVSSKDAQSFMDGIIIKVDGEDYKCLPARMEILDYKKSYVYIKE